MYLKTFMKCTEIYELDSAHFLSAPGLTWQAWIKNSEVKLELLANIDMLQLVEKGIKKVICHTIHQYAKTNTEYINE